MSESLDSRTTSLPSPSTKAWRTFSWAHDTEPQYEEVLTCLTFKSPFVSVIFSLDYSKV